MITTNDNRTFTARWIFPADRAPLPHGTITLAGDKFVAVEPTGNRKADVDLGDVAILPGLVNAHTHLDLGDARGKYTTAPDFTAWLRHVIQHRRQQTSHDVSLAIQQGIAESALSYGVTLVGDISADGASWEALVATDALANVAPPRGQLRATVFQELIGMSVHRASTAIGTAVRWMRDHPPTVMLKPGLSPHAPYSFRAEFMPGVAAIGKHVAIHLAETAAEAELLERQAGPFVPFLTELGAWDDTGPASSAQNVIDQLERAESLLLIHGNELRPETAIPPQATLVYCPRTHAAFGHPPHPFREFLRRGVRVVLGTDSLASNPDLDILAEARFVAAQHPDLSGDVLLRMITLDSAIALGWGDVAGSLTPGKSADLVVLPIEVGDAVDPHQLILGSTAAVERVMFRGQWIAGGA